jgi:epoxyqueuosine reductase QueG
VKGDREMKKRKIMSTLTEKVKEYALELGADLVGIANIERYEYAPPMMSPQGIMPEARSVVVMGIHHPDGCVEMGGEPEPQNIGPYAVQYTMNSMLDEISFSMGKFLEYEGYASIPIVSSNIWRYRGYEGLRENFAPDVSHIHAAVAAGLAVFGFSGLALTPEYGPRVRFVQVITSAELEPTPLIKENLCDDCGMCKKHCPSQALVKEINGMHEIKIEDQVYTYANKNLWRCAWGEHFDLDLNLEIPEHVTEEVILDAVKKHGMRGGEFGSCLRFCLPPDIRTFNRDYTRAPRRSNKPEPENGLAPDMLEQIKTLAQNYGCTGVVIQGIDSLSKADIDPSRFLPDAVSALAVYLDSDQTNRRLQQAAQRKCDFAAYRIARLLEDKGYSVVCHTPLSKEEQATILGLQADRSPLYMQTIFTSAQVKEPCSITLQQPVSAQGTLQDKLRLFAQDKGIDLIGISSAERLNAIACRLAPFYENRTRLRAKDRNTRFHEYDPDISEERVSVGNVNTILPDAKSVIVLGLHYPAASAERAGKELSKTIGPYVFARYESRFLVDAYALDVCTLLKEQGFKAAVSTDLLGLGGMICSPRGELYDLFSCRFAAAASGIAAITRSGYPATEEYGLDQVFIAVLTDAELEQDKITEMDVCGSCEVCVSACPSKAFFNREITFEIEGAEFRFLDRDLDRCDWSKRYALTAESGFGTMGSPLDIAPPEQVTSEALGDALKQHDPVTKYRPLVAEPCILKCPLHGEREETCFTTDAKAI